MIPSLSWFRVWHIITAIRFKKVICTPGRLASLKDELQGAEPAKISVLRRELSDLLSDEQKRFVFGSD